MGYATRNQQTNHVVVLSRRSGGTLITVPRTQSVQSHTPYSSSHRPHTEACSIEIPFGRPLAKVLIWLLMFQPVYVAMGMELEPVTVVETAPVVEEVNPVDDTPQATELMPEATNEMASEGDIDTEQSIDVANDVESDVEDDVSVVSENAEEADIEDNASSVPEDSGGSNVEDGSGETSNVEEGEGGSSSEEVGDPSETEETPEGSEGPVGSSTGGGGGSSSSDSTSDEDSTTTDEETATTTDEVVEQATSTDDTLEEVEEATTTPETSTVAVHTTEGTFTFSDGDCTLVADGEFYCVKKDVQRLSEEDQRVYSKQDIEGDREIYYFDGMDEYRITNNSYDDFAPVFEEETLRIVWQAMLNDRLQVMLHELPTNTTRQVTTARENSSNPHIAGDTLVWQQWVGTNWEVMMTDVNNDGGPFQIEQLTDNAVHDMFPRAYDDVITWQREKGGSWEIIVYDIRSQKETALQKDEGTKYENPRFVLLFDSKHENGDVETVGYDLDTGEMMELGTRARQVPEEPKTPNDETQDALPREATSTVQVKPVKDDDDGSTDV